VWICPGPLTLKDRLHEIPFISENLHVSENSLVGDGNTPQHSNARRCERGQWR